MASPAPYPNGAATTATAAMGSTKSAGAGSRGSWCVTSARATVVEDYTPSPRDIAAHGGGSGGDDDDGGLLALRAGQMVTVVGQSDDGWWAGALDGRLGRFPARCVRLLHAPRGGAPSLSASGGVAIPPRPSRGVSSHGATAPVVLPAAPGAPYVPPRPSPPSTTSSSPRVLPKSPSPRAEAGGTSAPPSKPPPSVPSVPSPSSSDGAPRTAALFAPSFVLFILFELVSLT
jgi:hypothetical protein